MGYYRKKPVVIEAYQLNSNEKEPEWFRKAIDDGILYLHPMYNDQFWAEVDTLEGCHKADPDDYIIKGVDGELYPCKPDIFEKTYNQCPAPSEKDDPNEEFLQEPSVGWYLDGRLIHVFTPGTDRYGDKCYYDMYTWPVISRSIESVKEEGEWFKQFGKEDMLTTHCID